MSSFHTFLTIQELFRKLHLMDFIKDLVASIHQLANVVGYRVAVSKFRGYILLRPHL